MDGRDLHERFPDLDFDARPPSLQRVNGCGVALCFARDADRETGTYVKTLCVTILFVPVFPLAAYRVADAEEGGWYVLGKEPAGDGIRLARRIAAAVLLVGTVAASWGFYTTTDRYKDGRALARAREAAASGEARSAASQFRYLIADGSAFAEEARDGLRGVVESISAATPPQDALAILSAANDPGGGRAAVVPDAWSRAARYAADPARLPVSNQVEVLESFAELAPGKDAVAAERRRFVERGAAAAPPDAWCLSELATELEAREDAAGIESLLAPHASRLGDLEGARILGQLRVAQGRFEEAFPLLDPYVSSRLARLQPEGEAFRKQAGLSETLAFDEVRSMGEPPEWYARHERADEAERSRMVSEAVAARLEKDGDFRKARDRYREAARVVPVAMDLGIVRMQRARATADPSAARRELEAAERVFTAIGGVAGGDPDYEFAAARVAFWLGKRDSCDAHLAAALEAGGGSFESRAKVATLLSSLGESAGARRHWEEAFAVAKTREERSMAAYAVSTNLREDPEQALQWIRKADASDAYVAAATAECEGRVAMMHGDLEAAKRALSASLAAYDKLPRVSVTLNNAALAATQLSSLTGRLETLEDAGRRLRDAFAELPSNLVVLMNTAQTLASIGWVRGMDRSVDLRLGIEGLREIRYDDAAGREAIRAAARESDEMKEALRLLDRGLGLVPGNAELLVTSASLADDLGDTPRLRLLVAGAARQPPDTEPGRAAYLASIARAADPEPARGVLASVKAHLDSLAPDASARDRAVVEVAYVAAAGQASIVGVGVDVADLDARARRLHREVPSSATRVAERITAALLVHRALAASDARYAREAKRTIALVGPEPLLAEALFRDPSLRESARRSEDFARLAALIEESERKFPDELAPTSRGLLFLAGRRPLEAAGGPAGAEPDWALLNHVLHAASPCSPRTSIGRAWALRIAGRPAEADAVLRECARLGGAVPYLE